MKPEPTREEWAERADRAERLAIIIELGRLDAQRARGLAMLARMTR